jgi:hypothetical protein
MIIETGDKEWPYIVPVEHLKHMTERRDYAMKITRSKNGGLFKQNTFKEKLPGAYSFKKEEHALMFFTKYGASRI